METITIKYDKKSKAGKAIQAMINALIGMAGVEVVSEEKESPYNPEFVKKIRKAEKEIEKGEFVELDTTDIWGSLGLS